ncbi:SpoIIE family protein phosphatase [Streptomyces flavidovirens]|uniref:SpoIIE family protein phosphatase n=1 Tax=Streptomyces flavidovirens TaxID=67298 RepID=A0ABW6RRL7_9ACTN
MQPGRPGEAFITPALLDIPDTAPAFHLVNCGHPPPLLLRDVRVTNIEVRVPAPPLGLTEFAAPTALAPETFPFAAGYVVLLYTDGAIEARGASVLAFYPLEERIAPSPTRTSSPPAEPAPQPASPHPPGAAR